MEDSIDGPSAELFGLLALMMVGAVFAAVDEAMAAFGEARARAACKNGGRDGATAARWLAAHEAIRTRFMTGRILCLVGAALVSYDYALDLSSLWGRVGVVTGAALTYATAIGVATTFATRRAARLTLPLLRYARPLELLAMPLAAPLRMASRVIDKVFPARPEDTPDRVTGVLIGHMIEQSEAYGALAEEDAELLKSVLEFQETVAREVMVPRTSMVAIDIATPIDDVVKLIIEKGHSRYPVYRDSIDRPVGILYAKDLFRIVDGDGKLQGELAPFVRDRLFYAAESQRISELLRQMQAHRVHLAIVVDEYGGTSGMVTLEDILEEIVGEIRDEHDPVEAPIQQIAPGRYLANADVSVHDLADITGLQLPHGAGSYESVGGMIVDLAGKVPESGESIEIGGHDLIVRGADQRHVTRVEVVKKQHYPPAAE